MSLYSCRLRGDYLQIFSLITLVLYKPGSVAIGVFAEASMGDRRNTHVVDLSGRDESCLDQFMHTSFEGMYNLPYILFGVCGGQEARESIQYVNTPQAHRGKKQLAVREFLMVFHFPQRAKLCDVHRCLVFLANFIQFVGK